MYTSTYFFKHILNSELFFCLYHVAHRILVPRPGIKRVPPAGKCGVLITDMFMFNHFWLQCPWNFSSKNTGVGCHFLLQRLFPSQGWNPCLLCLLLWQVYSLTTAPPEKPPNWTSKESLLHSLLNSLAKFMWCITILIPGSTEKKHAT